MSTTPSTDRLVVRRVTEPALLAALLRKEPVNPVDGGGDPEAATRTLLEAAR